VLASPPTPSGLTWSGDARIMVTSSQAPLPVRSSASRTAVVAAPNTAVERGDLVGGKETCRGQLLSFAVQRRFADEAREPSQLRWRGYVTRQLSTARMTPLAALVAVIAGFAGCGGTQPITSTRQPSHAVATTFSSAPSPPSTSSTQSAPEVSPVGTLTVSGPGTRIIEYVSLGQVGYGQSAAPPQEVLSSMSNQNDALESVIATSAFVQGEMRLIYAHGSLPATVALPQSSLFNNITGGFPANAGAIYEVNGRWKDGEGSAVAFTMQAGESETIPLWIQFPEARSNAEPTISEAVLDTMSLELVPTVDQAGANPTVVVSGRQAADCEGAHELLPFAKLPFSHKANPDSPVADKAVTCTHGSGVKGS